jgi:hypothetical protein
VRYPVRIVLEEGNFTVRIREVREWLNKRGINTGAFQYRMAAERIQLSIDFDTLAEAARFAETFGGLAFGSKRATPTAADAIEPPVAV